MRTPLYQSHIAQGAIFTDYQGWELPRHYGGPFEEYRAARQTAGFFDLSYRGKLRLTGPDRADFLHRLLSNDIKSLVPGQGCHATLLTPQGRILSDMRVLVAEDEILIEMEPRALAQTLDRLMLYKLTQRVEIEDVTERVCMLLISGPRSTELLEATMGRELGLAAPLQHATCRLQRVDDRVDDQIEADPLRVIRIMRTDELRDHGYQTWVNGGTAERLWQGMLQVGSDSGARPVGMEALNTLRVEAGVPWYGIDMDDSNFPQEARLEDALHWQKGCYVGQEPVARIKYRGHVNKMLVGLQIESDQPPSPGDKVFHETREVGRITSAVYSPHVGGPVALGYVRRESTEPDQALRVQHGDLSIRAVVAQLPFYRGNREMRQ